MDRSWSSLNVSPWIQRAISSLGFAQMTPVQAATIPLFLKHKDVVVEAVTGSGKTLAFLVPMLQKLEVWTKSHTSDDTNHCAVGGLIIAPTRELAQQIYNVLRYLLSFRNGTVHSCVTDDETIANGTMPTASDNIAVEIPKNDQAHAREHDCTWNKRRKLLIAREDNNCCNDEAVQLQAQLLVGGCTSVNADKQLFLSTKPQILVATPGRLLDLMRATEQPSLDCKSVELLVLDEADTLLDMGHQATLRAILALINKQRRTGLFSATMNDAVEGFLRLAGLRNSVKISVNVRMADENSLPEDSNNLVNASRVESKNIKSDVKSDEKRMPSSLSNMFITTSPDQKLMITLKLLDRVDFSKAIVFFATCACVDYFYALLRQIDDVNTRFDLFSLHGKLTPAARESNFRQFVTENKTAGNPRSGQKSNSKSGKKKVLLCTDVASRGLDIPNVELVIQIDPPTDPKTFSHRCGRAGRAGRTGKAVLLLNEGREESYIDLLRVRALPVAPAPEELVQDIGGSDINVTIDDLRRAVMADRALYDKGIVAFVSYVQAYRKHQASFIFRLSHLDIGKQAMGFALLHMPRMPELKGREEEIRASFLPVPDLDLDKIKYRDKEREKARQVRNAHITGKKPSVIGGMATKTDPSEASASESIVINATEGSQKEKMDKTDSNRLLRSSQPWSRQIAQKQRRDERLAKKERRRDAIVREQAQSEHVSALELAEQENDWKEFVMNRKKNRKNNSNGNNKNGDFDL